MCDAGAANRTAFGGPVLIADPGQPVRVLLKMEDYYRLVGRNEASLLDVMATIPGGEGIDFEPPRLQVGLLGAGPD